MGTRYVPFCFMSAMASSSSMEPCSIDATPARIAALIPWVPCAWAATLSPWRAASSTIARSSSSDSCCAPTVASKESTPAVAHTLITFAPCLI